MPKQHYILFDGEQWKQLLPLTATRAVADIRIGILTIKEKWEKYFDTSIDILTQDYLQAKYPYLQQENTIFINANVLPNVEIVAEILTLKEEQALKYMDSIVAFKTSQTITSVTNFAGIYKRLDCYISTTAKLQLLNYPWDIFTYNGHEIKKDIQLLGLKPNPEKLSSTNTLLGTEIYIEEGANCECSILNTIGGRIYLGKDSEVMEGCTIRGTFALCEHASLKMQTKAYGDTTVGPFSKVGGEISNSVIFGFSNKGHDGFLGNSVIGEWCNLGADTNNSNLKNNYGTVNAYSYAAKGYISTGLQFCGLIMGDHAKAAINTQFNTGTVVGVCANVFDAGFPPKFIRDFSWGNNAIFELEKAYEVAQRVMERRGRTLTLNDKVILKHIFEQQ